MNQATKIDRVTLNPFMPGQVNYCQASAGLRDDPGKPAVMEDPAPLTTEELEYFWKKYHEVRRFPQIRLSSKRIYIGAIVLILSGVFMSLTSQSLARTLGSIMMVAGSGLGVGYFLRSMWQKRGYNKR